jgi:uncharacterized membrane protein
MAKTLSFAGVHFTVAFGVGSLLSGSITVGGAIALVEPLCNTIAYFFHEKLWERRRRRQAAGADLPEEHHGSRAVFPV